MGLKEKGVKYTEVVERSWALSDEFLKLNPSADLPFLCDTEKKINIGHHYALTEYLDEAYPDRLLMGDSCIQKAQHRQLMVWFDEKFYADVFINVFFEKVFKRRFMQGTPEMSRIKQGLSFLTEYIEIIDYFSSKNSFLGGRSFSWVDISAAVQVSCLDYLGHIPWSKYSFAKEWYMKIKSRPSFRLFLTESFPGIQPAAHYPLLDF